MKFAVIQTGGKQYKVKENQVLQIEKIEAKSGKMVKFDKVLLKVDKDQNIEVGMPYLKGAFVEAEILAQDRGKKISVVKYKPKVRYKKRVGHRQYFTKVKIVKV